MPAPESKLHSSPVENFSRHASKTIAYEITSNEWQTKGINCKPLQKITLTISHCDWFAFVPVVAIPCA
jgi:hypothetical protein